MRASTSILSSALFAVALARPQSIDIDGVEAIAPAPVTGAPIAATVLAQVPTFVPAADSDDSSDSQKMVKRATTTSAASAASTTCTNPQPSGYGPVTNNPDTAAAFLANPIYNQTAASAITPDGYVLSFSQLEASTSAAVYLGYYALQSYDTLSCAQYCGTANSCYGFNIYIERDPSYDPSASCPNPASTVNYKCTLWGAQIDSTTATNSGQYRNQFQVVIAGSNGYNSVAPPPSQPGFTGPVEFGGAINAPGNTYMTYKYKPGPYDPSFCTSQCVQQNNYNTAHPPSTGSPQLCQFVNAYVLSKNGAPQGTYCSLYTQSWTKQYATNYGQYRGSDRYTVSQSYGYTLSPPASSTNP